MFFTTKNDDFSKKLWNVVIFQPMTCIQTRRLGRPRSGDLFQWEMERLAIYLKNLEIIFFPPSTTGILQPLDLAIFALVKSKYRKWLAQQKLFGLSTTEEQAVKQFNSIYLNLTPKCVNHGWWKSGLQKFRHLKSDQELEITDDYI